MIDRIFEEVTRGLIFERLPDATQALIREMPMEDIRTACANVLIRPQPGEVAQTARMLLNPCLAASWLMVFEDLGLPRRLAVYEPCVGSSEPVILAADTYSRGGGSYTTVNLNRPLAAELGAKLGKVGMPVRIIEDDASRLGTLLPPASVDAGCFHHAVNDILQTAVSEPRGMDTRTVDWWPNERQMIEWLAEDDRKGRLDECARPALVSAVRQAVDLVKPGGSLIFDHWTWEAYTTVDWFPWDLFQRLIPLAREWIMAERLPVREVFVPGRDPQWWMFLVKEG
jgi:hypothetical protein